MTSLPDPAPRSSGVRPIYGTGSIQVLHRSWWHFCYRYEWDMTFSDCEYHSAVGIAQTQEACHQQGQAADTRHAMHHARVEQKAQWPKRIRAD